MILDHALSVLSANVHARLDVVEVALLIARDEYPNLDLESELAELAALAHELRPRLKGNLRRQVESLSRYLFHEQGFEGDTRDYYDPRNSFLNDVLLRRVGLPISLSLLAIGVGRRAGLDVAGVGLPGHFIARASQDAHTVYFDPFHGGRILSIAQCEEMVEQVTSAPFTASLESLAPVPPGLIVLRILRNLEGAYFRLRDFPRAVRVIRRLRQLCPEDIEHRRDLGVSLVQAGQPGPAIDELEAYVRHEPPPMDRSAVEEILGQARGEVARWN